MTSVVGLVLRGLRSCAPDAVPDGTSIESLGGDETGVPLEPYRTFLDDVARKAGTSALLQAGRALSDVADPIAFVLLNSDSVDVLIEKEARLSRFIHSRHMVRVLERNERSIRLEHTSTTDDSPRYTENLASAGQHVTLFEELGCIGLQMRLPKSRSPERVVYAAGNYADPETQGCQEWFFSWSEFRPTRRPMPGLDEVLLSNDARIPLQEVPATVAGVQRVIRSDFARTWTLVDVALKLDTAPRTLQRALSSESESFSNIVDAMRVDEARRLLEGSELSITEIGYVCGFADTSHFSRRFKSRKGVAPSEYRRARTQRRG